jgi:hypothetical protein
VLPVERNREAAAPGRMASAVVRGVHHANATLLPPTAVGSC